MKTDPIPNIRFSIAKTYKVLVSALLKPQYPDEDPEKHNLADDQNETPVGTSENDSAEKDTSINKESTENGTSTDAGIPQPPNVTLKKKFPLGPRADIEVVKELINKTVIPNLEQLADDTDVDVRYFANKSLEEIDELVREVIRGDQPQA